MEYPFIRFFSSCAVLIGGLIWLLNILPIFNPSLVSLIGLMTDPFLFALGIIGVICSAAGFKNADIRDRPTDSGLRKITRWGFHLNWTALCLCIVVMLAATLGVLH